jgi:tol-pal system protein YbgF
MRTLCAVLLAGLVALGPLAGPAAAASREQQQMMADIRMLQEQTQQLQAVLQTLTEALHTVATRLDDQAGATRKAFADQKLLVDSLAGDIRVVREKLDETNVRLTSLSQDVEGVRDLIPQVSSGATPAPSPDGTMPAPAVATPGVPPAPGNTAVPPTSAAPPVNTTGTTPRRLYETAYADYTAGQWSLAVQGFETYIKTYPKSDLADDAQYYIGESYAGDSKFREAAAAYEKMIRDYPSSDQLPEAWYKVGISYDRLQQVDKAREAFEYVVKAYPDSDAGRLARQNLDRLNRRSR